MNILFDQDDYQEYVGKYRNSFEEHVSKERRLMAELNARHSTIAYYSHLTAAACKSTIDSIVKSCAALL